MSSLEHPAWVLDASALLAFIHREPGYEVVLPRLGESAVSAVNWSEVVQKAVSRGMNAERLGTDLPVFGLRIIPFTAQDAEASAFLWPQTRPFGLSLADRACLALGQRLEVPVLTTDRNWQKLSLSIQVQLIR